MRITCLKKSDLSDPIVHMIKCISGGHLCSDAVTLKHKMGPCNQMNARVSQAAWNQGRGFVVMRILSSCRNKQSQETKSIFKPQPHYRGSRTSRDRLPRIWLNKLSG
jgi:hypothetical protein